MPVYRTKVEWTNVLSSTGSRQFTLLAARPGALLQLPSLLVLDSFGGHLGDSIKETLTTLKTDLGVISCCNDIGAEATWCLPKETIQGQPPQAIHGVDGNWRAMPDSNRKE